MSQNPATAVLYEHILPGTDASVIKLESYVPPLFKAKTFQAFMTPQYVRLVSLNISVFFLLPYKIL